MTRPSLVIKVGTSSLLGDDGRPSTAFDEVAKSIRRLQQTYDVILVTSGAIGFGIRHLRLQDRPTDIHQLQALSMLGQVGLLERWRSAFGDMPIGQVLITRRELHNVIDGRTFSDSITALWQYGALPIINENDAVSTEEISFGDNDRLAAEVAVHMNAEKLILLTDQDGLQADFGTSTQRRLKEVSLRDAGGHVVTVKSSMGRGGANSKLMAAGHALEYSIETYIAWAAVPESIEKAIAGEAGTKVVQ